MKVAVSVVALAEFVHRRGDIHARLDGRATSLEGVSVQRKLQRDRGEHYQRERQLIEVFEVSGITIEVTGRLDGCDLTAATGVVEEFKTTRADAELAHAHQGSAHWAQLKLYAALLARELAREENAVDEWLLRLLYCHPDTLVAFPFEQHLRSGELDEFLTRTLAWYGSWWTEQQRHLDQRDRQIANLAFPFEGYRPHQQAMARRAYQALRNGEHLLLEAPTGSGKTMALIYPAVKSLSDQTTQKILFLTSKTTGAAAARDACRQIDPNGSLMRTVVITAKEKTCLVAGMPCDPARCQYANGYFDRIHHAVTDLLKLGNIGAEEIEAKALEHVVCPFELSLDAAVWADVIIADYNYVFDPVVRLQRFAERPDISLLIDESHQLAPRTRNMLSVTLHRSTVKTVLTEAIPQALLRRVRSIDRQFMSFKREHGATDEAVVPRPDALLRALGRFTEELLASEVSLDEFPGTRALAFDAFRWVRSDSWYDDQRFKFILRRSRSELTLRLLCLDPAPYLGEILKGFGGHIRFSGTVSPLDLYQDLHGQAGAPAERVGSPFSSNQLGVWIVDDVPTYWRQREQSLPALVDLVINVVSAKSGNYLVALPSYEYLRQFSEAFGVAAPEIELLVQEPAMTDEERERFLVRFADATVPVLGVAVMGGVFTESVDFSDSKLAGVICVGIGLPPPSLELGLIQAHFEESGRGREVAYDLPAMTRVLQAAGRILRSAEDRGVLCLVDARFKRREYQRFFPAHWQPAVLGAGQMAGALAEFWQRERVEEKTGSDY